jgi:protein TonB
MAGQSGPVGPIDAQIIVLPEETKHAAIPTQPVRRAVPASAPPQSPAPVQQPATQKPSQAQSLEKPLAQTSAPSVPTVSLPETNLPAVNKGPSDTIQPVFKTNAKISPQASAGLVTPPQFGAAYLNNPKPAYPAMAKRIGMEGTVMLKVLVSREGTALRVEVAQTSDHETLDKAAADAVINWRFIPARKGDSPMEEWVRVPVAFHLKK